MNKENQVFDDLIKETETMYHDVIQSDNGLKNFESGELQYRLFKISQLAIGCKMSHELQIEINKLCKRSIDKVIEISFK
jgi:hypothetical protein